MTALTFSFVLFFAATSSQQFFPLEPIVENSTRIVAKVIHANPRRKINHTKPHSWLNFTSCYFASDEGVYEHLHAIHILIADVLFGHVAEAAEKLKRRLDWFLLQGALIEIILLAEYVDEQVTVLILERHLSLVKGIDKNCDVFKTEIDRLIIRFDQFKHAFE